MTPNKEKETKDNLPPVNLVKTRVGDWEAIGLTPGKAERNKRMMESSMVRRNSMEETMSEFKERMSQSGEDKN